MEPAAHDTTPTRTRDHVRSRRNTPTPVGSTPQAVAGRVDSNRYFDERKPEPTRKRRNTDEDHIRNLTAEKESLRRQLLETRDDLTEAKKKNAASTMKVNDLLEEKGNIITQLDSIKTDALEKQRMATKRIEDLEARYRKREEELRTTQTRLRAAEEKNLQMAKLLEVKTADLNGVQTFLTTADVYSGAEIIAMVESLNAEIFQASAFMAELIEDETMVASALERSKNLERCKQVLEGQVRRQIGNDLFAHFEHKYADVRAEPLPLQLALQCLLSAWCTHKTRSFALSHFGDNLEKLYRQIRESEAQAIAGRWRAITSAQMSSFDTQAPASFAVDMLLSLLCLCGWSMTSQQSKKAVLSVQQMVFTIEKMWVQLKKATKEGITTADMEVFVIPTGSLFGEGMEDTYADNSSGVVVDSGGQGKRILCTVGMGLRRTTIKRVEGGPSANKYEVLLKPKVALGSVLVDNAEDRVKGEIAPQSKDVQ
ncbi:hypothetical protein BDZ97DRAFT_1667426 [Flammula alnicola]|nr:hypothetical protein BDZ97DRAFT_1667426 [Flammula alnicola]